MRRTATLLCTAAFVVSLAAVASLAAAGSSSVDDLLAQARAATARYHDADNAIADGYLDLGPNPAEAGGIEFVNFGLLDCSLDVTQPEALRYVESGQGLRLVAVEYGIPFACTSTPPDDFLPGIGEWEQEPDVPVWTKTVWIWSGSSIGPNGR